MNRLLVPFVLATCAATTAAIAQPARSKADERFEQGRKLMEAGKYDEACSAFEDSQALDPAVTTLLNLGACREKAGEIASAIDVFRAAVRAAQQDSSASSRQLSDIAAGHVKRLEPHVSTLTIIVAREKRISGLTIERNGTPVEQRQWGLPVQLDGGTYNIVAQAPGHQPWSTKIKLARENDAKTVRLPDLSNPPPSSDLTDKPDETGETGETGDGDEDTGSGRSLLLPISFGVAALAAGGTAYWFSRRGDDLYDQATQQADPTLQDALWHKANTRRYVAEGLAVAGIGFAAVSVWLFIRGGDSSSHTTVAPTASSDGGGVSLSGSF